MSVALSIVFTGLCALVVDAHADRAPSQLLLVDATGVGEVNGIVLPRHSPTLVANLASLANAETSRPTRVVTAWPDAGRGTPAASGGSGPPVPAVADQIGLWDLAGSEVWIRARGHEGVGVELYRAAEDGTSWPEPPRAVNDPGSWRDLRFVANMARITGDGRIDPALLATGNGALSSLPRAVAARIHLDSGRLEAGMPTRDLYRSDIFEFRGVGAESGIRQAVTDSIRWSLEADSPAVVIEIVPVAGGPIERLVLAPSTTPHALYVSNLPADNGSHEGRHSLSNEEMGALHFAAYYKLLANEPGDKPLPWLWHPRSAAKGAGFSRVVFCPGAVFDRP
jgi:hypothetical protein